MMASLAEQYSNQTKSMLNDIQTKTKSETKEDGDDKIQQPETDLFKGQDIQRSGTPETILTDYTYKPDITLLCDQCKLYVDIRQLKYHRDYHRALLTLNYKGSQRPESIDTLLKKRNAVIRRLKKEAGLDTPLEPKQIQAINEAYELLKADLEDTFEVYRQVREQVDTSCQTAALNCSPGCAVAVGISSSPNKRWKREMEDTKVYQDCFGQDASKCYLGLFDGYHGHFTAEVAASLLHKMFLHELCKFDNSVVKNHTEGYNAFADISHHSFVFGPDAKLDPTFRDTGMDAGGKCDVKSQARREDKHAYENRLNIHQDDDEMTSCIIQLCEEKYEKLQREFPSESHLNVLKSGKDRAEKTRHPKAKQIAEAFDKSYHLLDILMSYGKDEWSKVRWSGCSALTVLIESLSDQTEDSDTVTSGKNLKEKEIKGVDNKSDGEKIFEPPKVKGYIHLANAGSVRGVLVRGNRAYRLSRDHTPDNPKERDRVLKAGGTVTSSSEKKKVNGVLLTTRGLGNHGDLSLKRCILVEPFTTSIPVDQYAQFLVLGTSGIWELFSDQEVAHLLLRLLPANQIPPPQTMSASVAWLLGVQTKSLDSELSSTSKKVFFTPGRPNNQPITASPRGRKEGHSNSQTFEKDIKDSGDMRKALSERDPSAPTLTIPADLKTEVGSSLEDPEDQILLKQDDIDVLSIPIHSHLQLEGQDTLAEQQRELAHMMAEQLVQAALLAGAHENLTAMVVLLPGYDS